MKEKKDILFLCQFFYPEYISSATLPFDTACALSNAGYSVDVLCGYPGEYSKEKKVRKRESVNGIGIHRVSYIQLNRKSKIGRIINYFSFTASIFMHFLEMRKYKTVVVYSNPPMLPIVAAWAKKCFHNKLIFIAYDLYPELAVISKTVGEESFIVKIFNQINKIVFGNADRVVALSTEMKSYIAQNRVIENKKIVVIPNWYKDEGRIEEADKENIFYDKLKDKFVVSYLGNMGTVQDVEIILKAIHRLKNDESIHFLFAGHGNKLERIREVVAREKTNNVTIHGFLHGKEYKDALAISSCAVVSLISGATGLCCPSKTYGYMMQGIPIIAIMDESDIVADTRAGAGECVIGNNADELVQKIKFLKENRELRNEMSRQCRRIFLEKYTPEHCMQKYIDLIKKVM